MHKYNLIALLLLCWTYPVYALDIAYQYDDLNRLKVVNYGNGQQTITYAYDAAGNILSKDIKADVIYEKNELINAMPFKIKKNKVKTTVS